MKLWFRLGFGFVIIGILALFSMLVDNELDIKSVLISVSIVAVGIGMLKKANSMKTD